MRLNRIEQIIPSVHKIFFLFYVNVPTITLTVQKMDYFIEGKYRLFDQ